MAAYNSLLKQIPIGIVSVLSIFITTIVVGQTPQQKLPEKTRLLFLLDASGSMQAKMENTYRIRVAKHFLSEFVDSLRVNSNLEIGLRVYGHQYDRKFSRCDDSKLEVAFGPNNHDRILERIKAINPQGTTPIAYSLEQAAKDFSMDKGYRNVIILITDGIESCEGDPCAVSLALQKKGIFLKPFVIGIGMEKEFEKAFNCVGKFYDASDINQFRKVLNQAISTSLGKTSLSVELLDHQNKPTETNVNVSFINNFTQQSVFEFVHYRDAQGRPDTVEIDPVLNYDVVVNTVPPVVKKQVNIEPGKHNVLKINAPQGTFRVDMSSHFEYREGVKVLVKGPKNGRVYTVANIEEETRLLMGTYDIEVLCLPRREFKDVEIVKGSPRVFALKKPAIINIKSIGRGFGSVYEISSDGKQTWVCNLDESKTYQSMTIQPGKYKIVYRSNEARGSKFTRISDLDVSPGATLNVTF